jgi:predicted negative regulator of RcsB-dependent stress response
VSATAASPALPQPSLFEKILQVIQANLIWLIIAIIIIVLIAILRRWWIRRQNPALFRKSD